ncbi:MAG: TolC family protein [Gallionella sp.]|nr:TolC family protein [Gallionella sp.]
MAAIASLLLACALSVFANSNAAAAETSDPFGTAAMLPPRPALRIGDAAADPCAAQPLDHALNLQEVVNLALCNNPQTRVAWANSLVQAAQVGVGKSAYLPGVDLNAAANRTTGSTPAVNQRNVGVTFSYLLFDFGARSATLESDRQLLDAAIATQDRTVQSVFLAAVQDYYQVQAASAALDSARDSERAAKESYDAAEARYNAGSATPADKLQAQTAYSQATLNRISADGNLKNAQGTLANMLGMDANRGVPLVPADTNPVPDNFEGNISALIKQARQQRPDLLAAEAQVKAAQASADEARAAGRPTISLSASSSRYYYSGIDTNSSTLGVNLNVPLFSGFSTTYRVRSAEAQVEARNAQLEQVHQQVALDVWTAYQNLTTATQALRTTAVLLDSAQQSAKVALGRYKAGVGSILDVLNAQSALASAHQQRIQSTFNWNISRATLAEAMGSLDASLLQILSDGSAPKPLENQPGKNPLQKIQP